jgi:dTDP-4-amino-4,6-dideoxygalactose transaminase
MKSFRFSLQYPKPLLDEDLIDLIQIAKSGLFSRYSSDYVINTEEKLAKYYGTKHATLCSSGTAALHGALVALDFPTGSEIIVTSVADIGVVIPIIYENLIPVFADIDDETYNICPKSIVTKITEKTKAIIVVHLAGNPANIEEIQKICNRYNLILLEDFSQAHGASINNKKVGSFGHINYGSYQQSKQITCGEGGVILTNDDNLKYRSLIGVDKGWQRELSLKDRKYVFLAPNLRFNAIQASILTPQIKKLDSLIQKKKDMADILYNSIKQISNIILPQKKIVENTTHAYYSFPLYINKNITNKRNELLYTLENKYKLFCATGYANPLTLYQCVNPLIDPIQYGKGFIYSNRKYPTGTCPNAENLLERSFLIPFNENYTLEDTQEIAERLVCATKDIFI